MVNDVVQVKKIEPGFWYSFDYRPKAPYVGVDFNPLIFAFGDVDGRESNFFGLNIHLVKSVRERYDFIQQFQKKYGFMNDDIARPLSPASINAMSPGIAVAIREYRKQAAENVVRVKNQAVPLYIASIGNVWIAKPQQQYVDALIESQVYTKNSTDVGVDKSLSNLL